VNNDLVGLGTQLRQLLDQMDADVAGVLAGLGLTGYRPRYSPCLRAVAALGPLPIRDLARATGVTHSAASQTVAQLTGAGLAELRPGADARERIVHLTPRARAILPAIEAEWAATSAASAELDAELPVPLPELIRALEAALARRGFRDRILTSAWARKHPEFVQQALDAPA
jgi:DNA-binding MarR family transcriptional regulator